MQVEVAKAFESQSVKIGQLDIKIAQLQVGQTAAADSHLANGKELRPVNRDPRGQVVGNLHAVQDRTDADREIDIDTGLGDLEGDQIGDSRIVVE